MLKVGIIGASGFTGLELVKLLVSHKDVNLNYLAAKHSVGQLISDVFPPLKNVFDAKINEIDIDKVKAQDVVFLALPHGLSMQIVSQVYSKVRIIDLSADFRLSKENYEKWYKTHCCPNLLKEAIYGLPELNRQKIKDAFLVANPGCYATASILAVLPFLDYIHPKLIIDAKSGVSGAGKSLKEDLLSSEVSNSFKAYSIANHRHQPEINEILSITKPIKVTFVPHLLPINRGILATVYADLIEDYDFEFLRKKLNDFYCKEPFIRIREKPPEIKDCAGTNYCDISFALDKDNNRLIILTVIDNLLKGASAQAVQNMNIMFSLEEVEGLQLKPYYP